MASCGGVVQAASRSGTGTKQLQRAGAIVKKRQGAVQKETGSPNYFKFTREFKSAKI